MELAPVPPASVRVIEEEAAEPQYPREQDLVVGSIPHASEALAEWASKGLDWCGGHRPVGLSQQAVNAVYLDCGERYGVSSILDERRRRLADDSLVVGSAEFQAICAEFAALGEQCNARAQERAREAVSALLRDRFVEGFVGWDCSGDEQPLYGSPAWAVSRAGQGTVPQGRLTLEECAAIGILQRDGTPCIQADVAPPAIRTERRGRWLWVIGAAPPDGAHSLGGALYRAGARWSSGRGAWYAPDEERSRRVSAVIESYGGATRAAPQRDGSPSTSLSARACLPRVGQMVASKGHHDARRWDILFLLDLMVLARTFALAGHEEDAARVAGWVLHLAADGILPLRSRPYPREHARLERDCDAAASELASHCPLGPSPPMLGVAVHGWRAIAAVHATLRRITQETFDAVDEAVWSPESPVYPRGAQAAEGAVRLGLRSPLEWLEAAVHLCAVALDAIYGEKDPACPAEAMAAFDRSAAKAVALTRRLLQGASADAGMWLDGVHFEYDWESAEYAAELRCVQRDIVHWCALG